MLQLIKHRLHSAMQAFTGKNDKDYGAYAKRIMHRHRVFWDAADAEPVRNTAMRADASLAEWKSADYWQRKLSNKYNARLFAQMNGCRVPDLYWKGRDLAQLNFGSLPDHYVVRPTIGHSCNHVFLMDKGLNHMDRRFYKDEQLRAVMAVSLHQNPYQEFLIEEFVRSEQGEYRIPTDYKL